MEALIRRMYKQSNPLGPQVCPKYSVSVTFSPTLFHIVEIVHVILTVSRQHPPAAVLASGVDISSSMGVDISSLYWSWYLQFYWSWYLQVLLELISPGSTRVNISRFYWSWYLQVLLELISPSYTGVDISRFYWSWYLQVLLELISPGSTGVEIFRLLLHTSSSIVSFYIKPWNYEKNVYLKCWQFKLFRNAGTERTKVNELV